MRGMSTDSMVARVACVVLLLGLVGARPALDWTQLQSLDNAVTPWFPLRTTPVTLVRDTEGAGFKVADKGALFNFNHLTNKNGECNTQSSHECYCATFTDNSFVGHSDAAEWFIIGVTTSPVKRIAVWAEADYVTGVQVWFFDGSTHFYGRKDGIRGELTLYASERITEMSIWSNGLGRIGGISFKTSRGGIFRWGMTKREWLAEYETRLDVGSGLMMNIFGLIRWSDNTLYAIGFDFLRVIVGGSGIMKDIQYFNIPTGKLEGHKSLILQSKYENKAEFLQKQNFEGGVEVETVHNWDVERSIRFDNEFDIFGARPDIFEKAKDDWEWQLGQQDSQISGKTTEDRNYQVEIAIPAHKNYYAEAWLYSDSIDIPFDATIEFTLTTKATYKLMSYGRYSGKAFRKVVVTAYEYSSN